MAKKRKFNVTETVSYDPEKLEEYKKLVLKIAMRISQEQQTKTA